MKLEKLKTDIFRHWRAWMLCVAALATLLVVGPALAANETYTVVLGETGYHVENDPTAQVQLLVAPLGWTIEEALTPEQDSYIYTGDLEGVPSATHYCVPMGGSVTVTMTAEEILLPMGIYYGSDMAMTLDHYSVEGNRTIVGFEVAPTYLEESMLGMEVPAETTFTAPDAEGVAQGESGTWYYRDETGFFFPMGVVRFQVNLRNGTTPISMEELFGEASGLYGLTEGVRPTEGSLYEAKYMKELSLTLPKHYSHRNEVLAQVVWTFEDGTQESMELEAAIPDAQSFTLDTTAAEFMDLEIILDLNRLVGVAEILEGAGYTLKTLTYAEPDAADAVQAELVIAAQYSASKPQLSADGYEVTMEGPGYLDDGSLAYQVGFVPVAGTHNPAVTEIPVTVAGIGQNVTVAEKTGTGYRLTMDSPSYQGSTDPIWVTLEAQAQYAQSNDPIVTAPSGYTATLDGEGAADGDYVYYSYGIAPENGGAFGTDVTELELTVSGLVPVTAKELSGAGYRLTTLQETTQGSSNPLVVQLTVEASYAASVPTLTLTEPQSGYTIAEPEPAWNDDGSVAYLYTVTPEGGVFPENVTELTFAVSGIGQNVIVADKSGTGYRLTMSSPSYQGSTEPIWVSLEADAQYAQTADPVVTAEAGYTVLQEGEGAQDGDYVYYEYAVVPENGGAFGSDVTEIQLRVSGFVPVTAASLSGTGYRLSTVQAATLGDSDPLTVELTVEADYSASYPVLTLMNPASGYTVGEAELTENADGSLAYRHQIAPSGGVFPETEVVTEFTFEVSGVGRNVGIKHVNTVGYTLQTVSYATQGQENPIQASLTVKPDYSTFTPQIITPAGYVVEGLESGPMEDGGVEYHFQIFPENGGVFGTDVTEIELSISGLVTVSAAELIGTGYRLTTVQSAMLGSSDPLVVQVALEADYSASFPELILTNPASGYSVVAGEVAEESGSVVYRYTITSDSGIFPETETVTEFTFEVLGVGRNVGVKYADTAGYTLQTISYATQGFENPIQAMLTVKPPYSSATPQITAPAGYQTDGMESGPMEDGSVEYHFQIFPENGGVFGTDVTEIELSISGLVPVSAAELAGTGYRLTTLQAATQGSAEPLVVQLTVEPDYNASTPTLVLTEPAQGFTVGDPAVTDAEDGSVVYTYQITPETGSFPEDHTIFQFRVDGVVANVVEPTIRLENELDEGNISSDTILWPGTTVIEDGVSITTVTQEELDAMLELAKRKGEEAEKLEGDVLKEGIIVLEGDTTQITAYQLLLTGPQFQQLTDGGFDRFTVAAPVGELSLYHETMEQADGENDQRGLVRMTLKGQTHEGRNAVDATLSVAGVPITDIEEPYGARVLIPYQPETKEDTNALVAVYLPEHGAPVYLSESVYDGERGGLVLHVGHLSKFGVSYRPTVFTDVSADHWASPYITYLTSREVVLGDQSGKFHPDSAITRGEMVVLVVNALSEASLPDQLLQVYSDVPARSYLSRESNWLYYNNLDKGLTSAGKLRPYEQMTREDLAVLLDNVAQGIGLRIRSRGLDTEYTDAADIASYAKQAVTRLRAAGILDMASNYKYNPKATITRAEVAKIMAMLLQVL